jgi:predicted PurR-regulated permease PerM
MSLLSILPAVGTAPDYLVLIATLGGLAAFGLAGILLGPIIAAFFLNVWEMAADEFAPAEPPAAAPVDDGGGP